MRTLLFATFLCVAEAVSLAQVRTTGQLSGTVVDPSGAAVPNAKVRVTEPATGFTQSVTAGGFGEYSFPELQPGQYEVTSTAAGFSQAVYTGVVIEAARTTDLQLQMKVGASSQSVEVSAQAQVLETTTSTLSTTINPQSVQDLPLNGRDLLPMAELVAGAQAGGDQRFTTYNALPNAAINITVDGTNVNSQRYRTSSTGKLGLSVWANVLERRHVRSQGGSNCGARQPEYLGGVSERIQSPELDSAGQLFRENQWPGAIRERHEQFFFGAELGERRWAVLPKHSIPSAVVVLMLEAFSTK